MIDSERGGQVNYPEFINHVVSSMFRMDADCLGEFISADTFHMFDGSPYSGENGIDKIIRQIKYVVNKCDHFKIDILSHNVNEIDDNHNLIFSRIKLILYKGGGRTIHYFDMNMLRGTNKIHTLNMTKVFVAILTQRYQAITIFPSG